MDPRELRTPPKPTGGGFGMFLFRYILLQRPTPHGVSRLHKASQKESVSS